MTTPPLAEWAPHTAVWIGFPSAADLWEDDLAPAQAEVAAFAKAVHADGKGEPIWLVAADEMAAAEARRLAPFANVIVEPFGDIWLRDTAAIILGSGQGRHGIDFRFNGWGGKYDLPGDDTIGARLAAEAGLPCTPAYWILGDVTIKESAPKVDISGGDEAKLGVGNQNITCDKTVTGISGAAINSSAKGKHEITGAVVKIN